MKRRACVLVALLAWCSDGSARAIVPASRRLGANQDAFFVENDLVYRRFLHLARNGTYRQIDGDRRGAAEVDQGTWNQVPDGTVLLHFTRGGLRFHALVSGPLSVRLDDPRAIAALPTAAAAIRQWLGRGNDAVFAAASAREIACAPLVLTVDPATGSFRRDELEALARQIDDFIWSEQHRAFCLVPTRTAAGVLLLIPRGAVFQAGDLPRVLAGYPTGRGQPPPFYFAQVDAGTFAREAGNWQELR